MMNMFLLWFLSSCLILVIPNDIRVNAVQYAPEVSVTGGKIRGLLANLTTGDVVRSYLGISFAKAERFKAPEGPEPWSGVKDATSVGKACPQIPTLLEGRKISDMSEAECLNLNVYVPNSSSDSPALPVMVWIHGGGFIFGSNKLYDSSYIATLGNVIVVAINYRLGVFGFLATGKNGDLKGNYGMLDQVKGLQWVKENIAKFGGDPNKVTIFGESAGGASVSLLMLSPLAKGLFHNAILQSGASTGMWVASYYHEAKVIAKMFGKNIGCPDIKSMVDCLETKTMEQIVNASGLNMYNPVIDGSFLPDAPSVLLEKGQFEKYNTMVGVTNDEGTVFAGIGSPGPGVNLTHGLQRNIFTTLVKNGLLKFVRNQTPLITEAIIYRYTDWTNVTDPLRNLRMYIDLFSDSMFIAPAIYSSKAFAKKTAPTYFYQLQHRDTGVGLFGSLPSYIRANHGADLFFVFGFPFFNASLVNTKNANFSRAVIKLWTNFAKTGNPNNPNSVGISWPQYDLADQQYLALKPNMAVESKLRAEHVAFWNSFIPAALHATPTTRPVVPSKASAKTTDLLLFVTSLAASLLVGIEMFRDEKH